MLLHKKPTDDIYLIGASGWIGHAFRALQLINNLHWLGDDHSIYVLTDRHHDLFRSLKNVFVKTIQEKQHYFCSVKLFPYLLCPSAKRIMWLDTDILIPKKIDALWELRNQPIYVNTCSGNIIEDTQGSRWFFWDIDHTIKKLNIPYVYCLQNGWLLFNRRELEIEAYTKFVIDNFLDLKLRMYIDNKQYCDEPILGTILPKFGIKPSDVDAQYIVEDSDYFNFEFGQGTSYGVGSTTENKPARLQNLKHVTPAMAHFSGTSKFGDWRKTTYRPCVWYKETLAKAPWPVDYKIMDKK